MKQALNRVIFKSLTVVLWALLLVFVFFLAAKPFYDLSPSVFVGGMLWGFFVASVYKKATNATH